MTKLISRNTVIPTKKSQVHSLTPHPASPPSLHPNPYSTALRPKVFSTFQDNQAAVLVQVLEGERAMAKDNRLLGKFELTGLPPAPRGVPQIEVTFEIDANGILHVSAEDKGSGKSDEITITSEKGRLDEAEIQRMVEEGERFEEEDKKVKARIDAKNGLEGYLYNLKNVLNDDERGFVDKLSEEDKEELDSTINEALDWLDDHPDAETSEFEGQLKAIEQVANPI